ncbi:helix-turn-helix domain-containing protein [Actinokineospora terrae]|uniref:Cro/C1-type HTH DNA-binding domain-containing protein n=1 Tax=Actinokineospora terrae TaxID=155974 RepID=A0A1H9XQV5_9PSEU|nr:helix-turn-helix transcriptional regulator [Actinokineospora terrae]SES48522.1 Cro/C1-type HTH DNA-binding domain-containing protein [Actinokineospora terrae]
MAGVVGDWDAVSTEIRRLMGEREMNQATLIDESGISKVVVAELQYNRVRRTRSDHVLRALSNALGVHPEHLRDIAHGRQPQPLGEPPIRSATDIAGRLDALDYRMAELTQILRRLEKAILKSAPPQAVDAKTPDRD